MTHSVQHRCILTALPAILAFATLGGSTPARADILYVTSLEGSQIDKVNTATNAVTNIFSTPSNSDSLIFDLSGRIIYSQLYAGTVRRFDPATNSDVLLASGLGNTGPVDLALEPGGHSALVSNFGQSSSGSILRINLDTNAVTTLGTYGGNPEGLAYDSQGRLFANLGTRDGAADKVVAQLDPSTGAILHQSANFRALDGLTFDPVTGDLFASALLDAGIVAFDPNNLATATFYGGGPSEPDGITSNAAGDLYIASRGDSHIYQFDLSTHLFTQRTGVFGLDDLAPASGLGSENPAPVPPTIIMTGVGAVCLFGARLRGRKRVAA